MLSFDQMIIAFILGFLIDLFLGNRLGGTSLIFIIVWGLILGLKRRINFSREIKLNESD